MNDIPNWYRLNHTFCALADSLEMFKHKCFDVLAMLANYNQFSIKIVFQPYNHEINIQIF